MLIRQFVTTTRRREIAENRGGSPGRQRDRPQAINTIARHFKSAGLHRLLPVVRNLIAGCNDRVAQGKARCSPG